MGSIFIYFFFCLIINQLSIPKLEKVVPQSELDDN